MTSYKGEYGSDPQRAVVRDLHKRVTRLEKAADRYIGRFERLLEKLRRKDALISAHSPPEEE